MRGRVEVAMPGKENYQMGNERRSYGHKFRSPIVVPWEATENMILANTAIVPDESASVDSFLLQLSGPN